MNSTYRERYFHNGKSYTSRAEFYRADDFRTTYPEFETHAFRPQGPPQPLEKSLQDFLGRCAAGGKPVHILYSGGIDSEILLHTALKHSIPFVPVIADLFGMNRYELGMARKFLDQHGISNAHYVEVSERNFRERWLPELIFDCESMSYLLSGAYIAARSCPAGAVIAYSGESPNVVYQQDGRYFLMRHEYSLWAQKTAAAHGLDLREAYADPAVVASYMNYPAIRERMLSAGAGAPWTADHEYLSKEYLYTDPDFAHLARRYSQHGWEVHKGNFGYSKGFFPGLSGGGWSNREGQPYIKRKFALPFLLECQRTRTLDFDLAKRVFEYDYLIPGYELPADIDASHFNKTYFHHFEPLGGVESKVLTANDGKLSRLEFSR